MNAITSEPTPAVSSTALPLDGLVVLVTGNITGMTRDEAKDAVVALGGTPAPGVSAKVNLIVLGEGAGISKTAKARLLSIAALPGDTFAALAANPHGWDGRPVGMTFVEHDAIDPDIDTTRVAASAEDRAHWVGMGVAYVDNPDAIDPANSPGIRQVRLICACGHHWMRPELFGDDSCPRPEVPVTTPPWRVLDAL